MRDDLQRRGLAPKTQACDIAAVKPLTQHDRRAPAQRSDEARRQYVLDLLQDKPVAESPVRVHLEGSRCF
jgi:hypothetical protein